jgi:hypothetical protein
MPNPTLPNDYAKCSGHRCDLRESCLRYVGEHPDPERGVWGWFEAEGCEYFWEIEN